MKKIISKVSIILMLSFGVVLSSYAAVAVVVHPDNNSVLDERQVRYMFLGKMKTFKDGSKPKIYDLVVGNAAREVFINRILKKSESDLNSYWSRMMFSSKGKPPVEMATSKDLVKAISLNPDAIGYMDASDVDDSVKVLLLIE